jgi:hypothetical protein
MFRTIWRSCSWLALSCVYSAVRWSHFSVRWDMCCCKAMNSLDWVLDTNYELPTIETLRAAQVLGRSVGEPVHPIFIGSTGRSNLHPQIWIEIWMGRRIVSIYLPQPAIIGLLKIKKVIIIFNSIKIITYEIKWLNKHTTKCWAQLSTNCCAPFWQSWLRTCVSTNNSIRLGSRLRDVAYNEKN